MSREIFVMATGFCPECSLAMTHQLVTSWWRDSCRHTVTYTRRIPADARVLPTGEQPT